MHALDSHAIDHNPARHKPVVTKPIVVVTTNQLVWCQFLRKVTVNMLTKPIVVVTIRPRPIQGDTVFVARMLLY